MVRFIVCASACLCLTWAAGPALAEQPAPPTAPGTQTPSPYAGTDAGRLLALEIAARTKGGNGDGHFTPTTPVQHTITPSAAPAAPSGMSASRLTASTCGAAPAKETPQSLAARTAADGGMHFMPINRGTTAREFPIPARGEVTATAQALRAAVAGNKGESDLARSALESANGPSSSALAATEMANMRNAATVAPSTDPTQRANTAIMREIDRYRNGHGF